MINIPGYQTKDLLYESGQSRIYRVLRLEDDLPVIFKLLKSAIPTPEQRARFQQEYKLIKRMPADATLTAYDLVSHEGLQVMVLEDLGGISLSLLEIAGKLNLKEWLPLAIRITHCLGQLHQHHVMHKDINPSNIVWNRETNQVKIIDLGISTELSREVTEIRNPDLLEGTLHYMSPEQTGRMNRAIDYRTDLYSLGVTLYELLTGQLPFPNGDALELVHAHIAKQATPAHQISANIPLVLSAIIAKLMEKTAEARYQSASGLKADLQACLDTLNADGHIPDFELGQHDYSDRLQIPQKLYGRDAQVATLLKAFDRARSGYAELLLVKGYSGIGKSALVHEVQKPITQHRGYFIEGKFDQFKKDIPYAAFTQALQELIAQLSSEHNAQVQKWKERITQALGDNAQVMVDLIPNLTWVIGTQPPVAELPPAQAQNRLNQEFRKFVGLFATDEHPLAIFLDDLQWADLPSLQLMSLLLRHPATPHLLFIGAYRDNEVSATHPLTLMLTEMEKQGAAIHSIALPPLHLGDVSRLLQDTLHGTSSKVEGLTQLCIAKTQGNPFFLNQFLKVLVEKEMLYRDAVDGSWQWDNAAIANADITDNIVDLLIKKLQALPPATQRVLQGAACLGNVFDLKTLSITCAIAEQQVAQLLWGTLQDELIVPLDDQYKYAMQIDEQLVNDRQTDRNLNPHYRFQHDRVQQAAYLLSDESERAAMHLTIGRLLRDSLSPDELHLRLMDVVNHLNIGRSCIHEQMERQQLAQFNMNVARSTKDAAAYKPALSYAQVALELTGDDDWLNHYEFMLAMYVELADLAHLNADTAEMGRHIQVALKHAKNNLDRAKVAEIRIQAHISTDRFKEAVFAGLEVLEMLGISIPRRPSKVNVIISLFKTKWALRGKKMDQLGHLHTMTNPRMLAAMRILQKVTTASFYGMPKHSSLFVCESVRLSVQYGESPESAFNFSAYGVTLCTVFNEAEQGTRLGELALGLLANSGIATGRCRTLFAVHGIMGPLSCHLKKSLPGFTQAHMMALEEGDLEYVANTATTYCIYLFYCGHDLIQTEKEALKYSSVVEQAQRPSMLNMLKLLWQCIQNLMGQSETPFILQGAICDAEPIKSIQNNSGDRHLAYQLCFNRLLLCYLFGQYDEAHINAKILAKNKGSSFGFYGRNLLYFYESLVNVELLSTASPKKKNILLKVIKKNQAKLKKRVHNAPENFLNKWHLIEAKLAEFQGKSQLAITHFEQAIKLAKANGFLQEVALTKELMGRFYLSQGNESLAQYYLEKAQQAYGRWGAAAKVRDLAEKYPQWLNDAVSSKSTSSPIRHTIINKSTMSTVATTSANMLDLFTVMKSTQALSQEIVLARLLKRLMEVVIESAAAQRGVLMLKKDDQWFVEAEQAQGDAEATVLHSIPLDEPHGDRLPLPTSLVHYVIRSNQNVVIGEATQDKLSSNDAYVQQKRLRSLLCMPILHQGEMTGILYLENNAVSGAFTEGRLEVLYLLATQAAISIENARLYANMEERVAARTAELKAMSLRDGLTGVANRKAFEERMKEEFARIQRNGHPLSFLIIDIDHFKSVNDTYGHQIGDECLRQMGKVLTSVNRRPSDFVARYGGEEFAYVLSDTDMEGALLFAERVRAAVQTIVLEVGDIRHPITASIGVATAVGRSIKDLETLIATADRCLYAAKEGGRNCVVHTDPKG